MLIYESLYNSWAYFVLGLNAYLDINTFIKHSPIRAFFAKEQGLDHISH